MKRLLTSSRSCRLVRVAICEAMLLAHLLSAIPVPDVEDVSRIIPDTVADAKSPQNESSMSRRQPYRTGFHFQPKRNWMNDPNGPFFYKGWYHLFYQYNPEGAIWGNIIWGHAVSHDLVHWRYLEPALKTDHWYDIRGVWSGSATFLEDNTPVLVYTGWSNGTEQMQNLAFPEDPGDPLLRKWVKHPGNPILVTPDGYMSSQFRDPSTAWKGEDGLWRMIVGAFMNASFGSQGGVALLFKSSNFVAWNRTPTPLYWVQTTGMWECPDFFPVHVALMQGLETSAHGDQVKHVLKVSMDSWKHDYYSVGTYNRTTDTYKPEISSAMEPGIGLRYDYGKFYASKTFFDPARNRRILWGWVNESSSIADDVAKGWSSVMALPRGIWLDPGASNVLIQWPIDEILTLRQDEVTLRDVRLAPGSTLELSDVRGVQLDIEVLFAMPELDKRNDLSDEDDVDLVYDLGSVRCKELASGVVSRSQSKEFGPFGLYVLASEDTEERTAVFFHLVHFRNFGWQGLICSDQSNSTLAEDADKTTYGSYVHVAEGDQALSLRVLVDHSIVESFAQGGRTVVTSRVYPQFLAHNRASAAARMFLFNDAAAEVVVKSITVWHMDDIKRRNL
ncbi:hypothetical protein KC19_2G088700 [Ceratodon purpureus]|uniref:Beta-fructofuranosidase n=1 Tax=Ceratodon purpureus TaxID=3225 RepID=A0A8T0ITC6_CERPU|nr:hypothetical protein KC19_2G088700 [Ceratodon purpureus]